MIRRGYPPLLTTVAAYGLSGADRAFPARPLDNDEWQRLLRGITDQRLAGMLAAAIADEALPATARQAEEALARHAAAMSQVLLLDRLLLDTVSDLERSGIDYRVMKGAALAHTAYENPALRAYGDVDLIVPSDRFDEAVAVLEAAGCQRRWPQLRPGFDRRFGKGATLVTPDRYEIDLHRTFTLGPFGLTVDLPELFQTADTFSLGGRKLPTFPAEERFLLACYHAALGHAVPRLMPLRDVAQVLLRSELDLHRIHELSSHWQGSAVIARAVRSAWHTFGLADAVPMSVWAARYEPTRTERRSLAVYARGSHSYGGKALASLRAIPGMRAKAAFLRALALPQRSTVGRYEPDYRRWWARGGTALLRRGGGR